MSEDKRENVSIILNYENNGKSQELTFVGTVTHFQHDKTLTGGRVSLYVKDVSRMDNYERSSELKTKLFFIPFTVDTPAEHELVAVVEACDKDSAIKLIQKTPTDKIKEIMDNGRNDIKYGDTVEIVRKGEERIIHIEEIT